jgi:peptidyl-prolyl cis-trans isomerase D
MLQRIRDKIVNVWVAGVIIGLIAITFVFWGVDFNLGGPSYAARVNGDEISLTEFDRAYQNELFEYQEMFQTDLDETLRRELRRNVLDRLIGTRALQQRVNAAGYYVTDERVIDYIRSMPAFHIDGRFSVDAYTAQLRFAGYTPAGFEALQRSQLQLSALQDGIVNSAFLTPTEFRRYIELYNQQREIGFALFSAERFLDEVEVGDEDVASHYNANRARYRTLEAVDLEYIEVRRSAIAEELEVTEDMLRDYYERERDRFETVEERRARHILFTIGNGGEPAARERAEAALGRLEAGEDFEALAAELSDDAGTRASGGDLGWLTAGLLGGAFDEALYAMDVGEIEGPVRTDFGLHLIRLDGLRAGDTQPFEVLRDELYEEYSLDLAEGRYFDLANELADRAFDAYDELATVAAQMGLPVQSLEGFTRAGAPEVFANSARVVQAAFSSDALERRLNSRLLELSDDQVVVLRVREHHPPAERPLDDVYDEIVEELSWMRAGELARQAADAFYQEASADMELFARLIEQAPTEPADSANDDEASGDDEAAAAADDQLPAEAPASTEEQQDATARLVALAERHGGEWFGPRWTGQSDALTPTEVLSRAFSLPKPVDGEVPRRERVSLASGDQAVLFVSAYRPGQPGVISQNERDMMQRQLAEQSAVAELMAYANDVREKARIQIPSDILDEPDFMLLD